MFSSISVFAYEYPKTFWSVNDKYVKALETKDYNKIIEYGNQIINLKTGEEIYRKLLTDSEINSCIDIAKANNLHIHIYTDNEIITKDEYNQSLSEEWKELRVDYSAPKEFLQIDNWMYAISKFPEKGTVLYPYRRRKTARNFCKKDCRKEELFI